MVRQLVPVLVLLTACGGKKPVEDAAPLVGWQPVMVDEVTAGDCYYPPVWEELGVGDRRIARQHVLEAMMSQWNGSRDDGVSFDETQVMNLETVLLGHPDEIEGVATGNVARCVEARKSGSTRAWGSWIRGLPDKLTEGECTASLLPNTLFDYLDIGRDWHIPAPICAGERIHIIASDMDYYRISDDGPWINAAGDTSQPTSMDLPCNTELCHPGQLILRFTSDDGVTEIVPVGLDLVYEPTAHGKIEVMINDTTFYDNVFKNEGGIIHHTQITYEPAD